MEDTIYLLVKVKIKTPCKNIHDAIEELQAKTKLQLTDTKNVRVIHTGIMPLKTRVKAIKITKTH